MAIEGDQSVDMDFRRAVRQQNLTAVAMVTAALGERVNVMACEWAMMVTVNPMRFAVSVGPRHATHDLIAESGEFGLSFCSDDQAGLSHVSGSYSMRDVNKWELADFSAYPARKIRAPMISGCSLNVECKVVATNPLGDHTVFIGEALWVRYDPEKTPLSYHRGKYFRVGAQLPKQ